MRKQLRPTLFDGRSVGDGSLMPDDAGRLDGVLLLRSRTLRSDRGVGNEDDDEDEDEDEEDEDEEAAAAAEGDSGGENPPIGDRGRPSLFASGAGEGP